MRELKLALAQTNSYREFIETYLRASKKNRKVSYTELAQASGLSSKGYVSEVLRGRRRISARSVSLFSDGMKLSGRLKEFFHLLVLKEEPHLRTKKQSTADIDQRLEKVRKQINPKDTVDKKTFHFSSYEAFRIFASLGPVDKGATALDVSMRSGLPLNRVTTILDKMKSLKFVQLAKDRWYATSESLDIDSLGDNQSFQELFISSLEKVASKAKKMENSSEDLFFFSSFSIKKENEQAFKQRLREVVLDCMDQFQADDGDLVKDVLLAGVR